MSFLTDYFGIIEGATEVQVCCPFPHFTGSGLEYKETRASAHVNTEKNLFHCKSCGTGLTETQFIQRVLGCGYAYAKKLQRIFKTEEDILQWETFTTISPETKTRALNLGISEEVLEELKVRTTPGTLDTLAFPVFMYGHLLDVRNYNPGGDPKIRSRASCPSGLIIPFDIWVNTNAMRPNLLTLICAGEKDMAVARSHGFNAITITGGENCTPQQLAYFKDRIVAIVYDNDGAGLEGAKRVAAAIHPYAKSVRVVTGFHEVCSEKGEDITDFFVKYQQTKQDLINYIEATPMYVPAPEDKRKSYPVMDLRTACMAQNIGKVVQSNIQVVAVSESTFAIPSSIIAEKYAAPSEKDVMQKGDFREWELSERSLADILHLMDNGFKESEIEKNIRNLLRIPFIERGVSIQTLEKATIFKSFITDMFETSDMSTQPMEFTAYSVNLKLESGQKYLVSYKIVPHPYKGQQLTMLIFDAVQANDSVSNFTITDTVKQNLDVIKNLEGSVEERINLITERMKGLLGYNGNNTLINAIDLSYHTVLQFHFGNFKNVRGYLDTIIVGESRMGKSSTAETLRKAYGLGVFTSLAGNSATVPGLVGGSNKTANGYQTRAGIIPQNHRGLIIFEEFGKSNANVITELTDIRSSNEVRITRVSGTITLPAMVRMIALTNVKNTGGTIKPIASYPNGLSIITELVSTAEDIARYDLIIILSDRGNAQIDPLWIPETPFDAEVYKTRVRWVWSRTAEQVIIPHDVALYIVQQANELNSTYDCHIKIFGTEAWKKISRLAIAVAGYLVSTDETYSNIIVTKEHVDYAINYFKKIYDNKTFKLKEYVENERRYSTVDQDAISNLQSIYDRHASLILQLEQCATTSKAVLGASTGLNNDDLNKALNQLTRGLFIRFAKNDIIPTERFRLALAKIERRTNLPRVGE